MTAVVPDVPAALPPDEPVFDAPWQAQVFALTVALADAGVFAWPEWTERLSREIARGPQPADEARDASTAYWICWTAALERLLVERGIAAPLALASLRQSWRIAFEKAAAGETPRLNRAALRLAGIAGRADAGASDAKIE